MWPTFDGLSGFSARRDLNTCIDLRLGVIMATCKQCISKVSSTMEVKSVKLMASPLPPQTKLNFLAKKIEMSLCWDLTLLVGGEEGMRDEEGMNPKLI